jgi:hypothetical protein
MKGRLASTTRATGAGICNGTSQARVQAWAQGGKRHALQKALLVQSTSTVFESPLPTSAPVAACVSPLALSPCARLSDATAHVGPRRCASAGLVVLSRGRATSTSCPSRAQMRKSSRRGDAEGSAARSHTSETMCPRNRSLSACLRSLTQNHLLFDPLADAS